MLITAASTRITTKIRNTRVSEYPSAQPLLMVLSVRSRNVAAPYATDAVTASSPIRLSQPVKKPAAGPPILAAHQ